ncbi:toxic anion resistance protein [Undibacterium sp. JH2W]|uniref:toxic anion resistance protein n=1 Tax=Undibacterium sp. JH2W TaxID=3413037 RepID=UPI003BF1BE4E
MDERSVVVDQQISMLPQLSNVFTDQQKINIAAFSEGQRQRVAQIVAATGELDSAAVTSFGTEQQIRMNQFLDELLVGIRTVDVGEAGAITLELARQIKTIKLAEMKAEVEGGDWVANSLGKLPLIGKYASALRYFQLNHAEIIKYLKEIEDRAQRERGKLAATNGKLDQLVERTIDNIRQLELYLAAGQSVLMRAKARFADKQADARMSNDQVAIMRLRDEVEQINAFEARLLRMHIGYTDALLSVPQIRLTQEAARIEERNIMDTILFDLPRLKSAILRVASLKQIIDASAGTEARREITRQVGSIGGDLLQQAYTQAKQSQGSGAEDVALLSQTADKILETIALGIRLDEENRQKRKAAETQLGDIKVKLLEGLRANTNDLAQRAI